MAPSALPRSPWTRRAVARRRRKAASVEAVHTAVEYLAGKIWSKYGEKMLDHNNYNSLEAEVQSQSLQIF